MKKAIIIILVFLGIAAICSYLFDGLYAFGKINGLYAYFYNGSFVLCSNECFLKEGELMFNYFLGYEIHTYGVFYIWAVIAAILTVLGLAVHFIKKIVHKCAKNNSAEPRADKSQRDR